MSHFTAFDEPFLIPLATALMRILDFVFYGFSACNCFVCARKAVWQYGNMIKVVVVVSQEELHFFYLKCLVRDTHIFLLKLSE